MAQVNQSYLEQPVTLGAGKNLTVYRRGRSVQILELSGSLQMQVDGGPISNVRAGVGFESESGEQFETLYFYNPSASPCQFTFVTSTGKLVSNQITIAGAIQTTSGDTLETPAIVTAGNTATPLVAANASRRALMLQNLSEDEYLWIGDSNVGNNTLPRGIRIDPGGNIALDTSAAVYGRRGDANDVNVAIAEIKG